MCGFFILKLCYNKNMELKWEAQEFEKPERSVSWYWISIIIATLLIAFAIWQKDFFFGFFILIAEILIIVWGDKEPRIISFTLTEKEITIDPGKTYALSEMEYFSVFEKNEDYPLDEIIFKLKGKYKIPFIVQIPKQKLQDAKNIISKVLKETPYDPSFIDSIQKISKF
jgi:hypothetical protein